MSKLRRFLVTFTTPESKGAMLKEEAVGTDWYYAKLALTSRYKGIRIMSYTEIK